MDVASITPDIDKKDEEKITNYSEYKLIYDQKKYSLSLSLSKSNKLILKMKEINNFSTSYYISINTLEDLKKIDTQFNLYNSVNEVFESLNNILKANQTLIKKSNEKLLIQFCFPVSGNFKKEIFIPIKLKNYEQKYINDEIIKKINNLEMILNKEMEENKENKKSIIEYKIIIEENKKRIYDYEKMINILKDEIKQIKISINGLKNIKIERNETEEEQEIEKEKEEKEKEGEQKEEEKGAEEEENKETYKGEKKEEGKEGKFFGSNIIKEKREYELIENRLKIAGNNKKIKYKLLYRASVDGDKAKTFHQKCDRISGTLTMVKTTKNMKFGGYTKALWDGNGWKKDEKAFCFSLNLNKIYNISNIDNAIYPKYNYGPRFAFTLFGIEDEAFKKGDEGGWCSYDTDNQYGKINNKEITGGEEYFGVSEVEVYQIAFE